MELVIGNFWQQILIQILDVGGAVLRAALGDVTFQAQQSLGAVGSAIAAYLQTKGLIDQARILQDFKPILEWIAAGGWLMSVGLAVGSMAVFGNYRQGLYLMIGPALFYYMITTTSPTNGTELRFGDHVVRNAKGEQSEFLNYIRAIGDGTGAGQQTVQVSFFFGLYDSIISEGVQTLVSFLVNTINKDHLRFEARERALNYVISTVPNNGGFVNLIAALHYGECAEETNSIQALKSLRTREPVQLRPKNDLLAAQARYNRDAPKGFLNPDGETREFLINMKKAGVTGFQNVPDSAATSDFVADCKQVWDWISAACIHLAKNQLTLQGFLGERTNDTTGTDWEQVRRDVEDFIAAQSRGTLAQDEATKMVAAYIYKNTLNSGAAQSLTTQAFSRVPVNAAQHNMIYGPLYAAEAHGGFFKLKYFAASIPYIQGLLLYLLSIAFPFFAVFLVFPGKAVSFLVWCSLWAWVKSWDIGFAVVHVARDIFWHMLKNRVNRHSVQLDWSDPASILSVIFNNDVFFTENTYWEIVSFLTCAVPFVTAHFCMGATELFGMFRNSIDQTAERFKGLETNASRRFVGNTLERMVNRESFKPSEAYSKEAMTNADATTVDGQKIPMTGAARSAYASSMYGVADMLSKTGTKSFTNELTSDAARSQEASDKSAEAGRSSLVSAHMMRGAIPMEKQASLDSLKHIYGDAAGARIQASGGMTWGQIFNERAENQVQMGALLSTAVNRKMHILVHASGDINDLTTLQTQTATYMKNYGSSTDGKNIPFLGGLVDYLSGGTSNRPGLEGDQNAGVQGTLERPSSGGVKPK